MVEAALDRADRQTPPRKAVVRNEILDAAAVCFSNKGFAATSINDIADLLAATKGRVYHHYRSKADLFFDVHLYAMEMDFAAIRGGAAKGRTPIERLHEMALAHVHIIMEENDYQRVAMQGVQMHLVGSTSPDQRRTLALIVSQRDEYEGLFREHIADAIARGDVPAQDDSVSAKAFLGVLNWVTLWFRPRAGQTAEQRRAIARDTAAFAIRGLGGQP